MRGSASRAALFSARALNPMKLNKMNAIEKIKDTMIESCFKTVEGRGSWDI
jgi:hypothetical protein